MSIFGSGVNMLTLISQEEGLASWGSSSITTANATSQVTRAVTRDNAITAFIIPDLI